MKFFNYFQQKNRNRAIHITDIAIEKVPQTNILGFDNEHILTKTFEFNADKAIADYIHLSMQYYNKGYKNNNGTLAIKEILKNSKQYGLIYKKGRKKL